MKRYITIDIGCHECGVGTEVIGVFKSKRSAVKAMTKRTEETDNWREGGQSIPEVFTIEIPE